MTQLISAGPDIECNKSYGNYAICGTVTKTCDEITDAMQDIVFKFDDANFTLPPAAYTLDSTMGYDYLYECTIGIDKSSNDRVIVLGNIFLNSYTVTL